MIPTRRWSIVDRMRPEFPLGPSYWHAVGGALRTRAMPVEDGEFGALMLAMQRGSREAAERFCREYQSHILRIVRRRLMKRLRVRYDSLDLVNDVWLSFFSRPPRLRRFESPLALIGYLEQMTQNKVIETARHAWCRKQSPAREEALNDIENQPIGRQPTPSKVMMAREEFARVMEGRPAHQRRILAMLGLGMSQSEVARRLRTNTKTVQRLIRNISRELTAYE